MAHWWLLLALVSAASGASPECGASAASWASAESGASAEDGASAEGGASARRADDGGCAECGAGGPRARTAAGWVCGARRVYLGTEYASFLGVQYAKQPLGELRFQELQPPEPWTGCRNATEQGPICPQSYSLYRDRLPLRGGEAEDCIYADVHVPLDRLPAGGGGGGGGGRAARQPGLSVFVFIHGGGFAFGSGKVDIHGAQYLVRRNMVVITFNYRLGPFGFLSLDSPSIPGNAGLRDMVTLLRWVQSNVKYFGGNPDDVTLAGQSAGGVAVHLLSLSEVTQGLFKRIVMMSGTAVRTFYTPSPAYAAQTAREFTARLGINSSDPEAVHAALVRAPLRDVMRAHAAMVAERGFNVFNPVVESRFAGVTRVVDADPERLLAAGRGRHLPAVIGFTEGECECFRYRFEEINIIQMIKDNPVVLAPPYLAYTVLQPELNSKIRMIEDVEFNDSVTLDAYIGYCTKAWFQYPALYVARKRVELGGAPVYMYQFSYKGKYRVFEPGMPYVNASHIEDVTYIFRTNVMPRELLIERENSEDYEMINFMTDLFANFIHTSNPISSGSACSPWPATGAALRYLDLRRPGVLRVTAPSPQQEEALRFFDDLYA